MVRAENVVDDDDDDDDDDARAIGATVNVNDMRCVRVRVQVFDVRRFLGVSSLSHKSTDNYYRVFKYYGVARVVLDAISRARVVVRTQYMRMWTIYTRSVTGHRARLTPFD